MLDRKRWFAWNLLVYGIGFIFILWVFPFFADLIPPLHRWLSIDVPSDVSALWLFIAVNILVYADLRVSLADLFTKKPVNPVAFALSLFSAGVVQLSFWALTGGILGRELTLLTIGLLACLVDAVFLRTLLRRVLEKPKQGTEKKE